MLRFIKKAIRLIDFFKKNWLILLAVISVTSAFCLFYGRFGDVNIDCFREAYIPAQMLNGKILYKNIFCIYPPLGYMINAVLFKVFGVNLSVLYFAGLISTLGIFHFANKICKIFFNDFLSFGINLILFAGLVLSPNVFNSFFPYSYGMLYGILFALGALYFSLNKKFSIAYIFCSLALCSKAEFLPILPALLIMSPKESFGKNSASFIIPFILIFGMLFAQGLRFSDLLISAGLVKLISGTQTLHEFYSAMGLVPRIEHLNLYLNNFVKFIFPINWTKYQEFLVWIFPAVTIFFAFRFKKLTQNEIFFVTASVLISLKVFFALTLQSYGVYYLIFGLISLGILFGKNLKNIFAVYLIIWGLIIGFNNTKSLLNKNFTIKSKNGIVKTTLNNGKNLSALIETVADFPEKSKVVIYPENLAVNYFTGKKSDDKFYSLIPLYVETFGEENIIKRIRLTKPDFIIITDYNTFAYGYSKFGTNYAIKFKNYIDENYTRTDESSTFIIYKK